MRTNPFLPVFKEAENKVKALSLRRVFCVLALSCVMTAAVMINAGVDMSRSFSAYAAASDSQKQIHELQSKLSGIQSDAKKLKEQIAAAKSGAANLETEIQNLEYETTLLSTRIKTMETLINQLDVLYEQQGQQIEELSLKEAEEQKIFDNMLRMSYMYGSDTYFHLLFGSENIGDFLSRVDFIVYHFRANNNVLERLSETKASLEKTREEQKNSKDESVVYKSQLEQDKKEYDAKIAEANQKKTQYMADAANAESLYKKKLAETNAINAEIKALYEEQRKNNTASSNAAYSGTMGYPLPSSYTTVSSGFITRTSPISGKTENHNGLDLPAPRGTSIYAADAGKVVIARHSSSWGNYVTIDHGGGIMTLYAHASSLNVTVGQTVKKGDTIAYVGSTGWSTGNHLHFTVYKNGVAVNPAPYIGL